LNGIKAALKDKSTTSVIRSLHVGYAIQDKMDGSSVSHSSYSHQRIVPGAFRSLGSLHAAPASDTIVKRYGYAPIRDGNQDHFPCNRF